MYTESDFCYCNVMGETRVGSTFLRIPHLRDDCTQPHVAKDDYERWHSAKGCPAHIRPWYHFEGKAFVTCGSHDYVVLRAGDRELRYAYTFHRNNVSPCTSHHRVRRRDPTMSDGDVQQHNDLALRYARKRLLRGKRDVALYRLHPQSLDTFILARVSP